MARMTPEERKAQLLEAAYAVAKVKGMLACTRRAVTTKAKVSESLPNRHWTNVDAMQKDVLLHAVTVKDVKLLRKARDEGYELALIEMPRALRRELGASK